MKRLLLGVLLAGCDSPAAETTAPPPIALTTLPKAAANAVGVDYPAATVFRTPPHAGYSGPTHGVTSTTIGAGGGAANPFPAGGASPPGAAAQGGAFP